jgi:hypothetical protein
VISRSQQKNTQLLVPQVGVGVPVKEGAKEKVKMNDGERGAYVNVLLVALRPP